MSVIIMRRAETPIRYDHIMPNNRLQPLGARILVKRLPPPEQTQGGIYLLGREYPTIGKIVRMAHGRQRNLLKRFIGFPQRLHLPEVIWGVLQINDFVMFHRDAIRQELVLENDYVILNREHCLAAYQGESMKSFRPLGDRILIKPLPEVKQIGSIALPDQAVERPVYGIVVAVGMGHFCDNGMYLPCDVNVGDKVLYGKFMGSEVKLDNEDHLLVREDDILGVERG